VNKNFCDEIALIPSKKLRNKIAGYVTHLIKRMKKGSVSGISLKLQEDINKNSVNRTPDDEFEKKIRSLKLNSEIRLLINYLKKSSVLGEEAVSLQLKN
jgi:small subunit ribosomal protein S17e